MPSEADIAREIGRDVDPDANFAPARICARRSATHLGAGAAGTYDAPARRTAATARTPPAPAGARCAMPALDLLAATGQARRHRARDDAISGPPTT